MERRKEEKENKDKNNNNNNDEISIEARENDCNRKEKVNRNMKEVLREKSMRGRKILKVGKKIET